MVGGGFFAPMTGGDVSADKAMLFPRRNNVIRQVVVPGGLSTWPPWSGPPIPASVGVAVPDSDGAVGIYVVVGELQRAGTIARTVAILDPAVLEVRLQLSDVVVGLGGLWVGLRVGPAGEPRAVVEEHVVVRGDLCPVDGYGVNGGGGVEGVHPADGGVTLGSVVAVTLVSRSWRHVPPPGVSSQLDGVVVGPGAQRAVPVIHPGAVGDLRLGPGQAGVGGDALGSVMVRDGLGGLQHCPLVVVCPPSRLCEDGLSLMVQVGWGVSGRLTRRERAVGQSFAPVGGRGAFIQPVVGNLTESGSRQLTVHGAHGGGRGRVLPFDGVCGRLHGLDGLPGLFNKVSRGGGNSGTGF